MFCKQTTSDRSAYSHVLAQATESQLKVLLLLVCQIHQTQPKIIT